MVCSVTGPSDESRLPRSACDSRVSFSKLDKAKVETFSRYGVNLSRMTLAIWPSPLKLSLLGGRAKR